MNTGKVKWYNDERGFGFVIDEKDKQEYFFHASKTDFYPIVKGDKVTFDLRPSKRVEGKTEAINVQINE